MPRDLDRRTENRLSYLKSELCPAQVDELLPLRLQSARYTELKHRINLSYCFFLETNFISAAKGAGLATARNFFDEVSGLPGRTTGGRSGVSRLDFKASPCTDKIEPTTNRRTSPCIGIAVGTYHLARYAAITNKECLVTTIRFASPETTPNLVSHAGSLPLPKHYNHFKIVL